MAISLYKVIKLSGMLFLTQKKHKFTTDFTYWIEIVKEFMKPRKEKLSYVLLVLGVAFEWCASMAIVYRSVCLGCSSFVILLLSIVLMCCGRIWHRPKPRILAKLFANTIEGGWFYIAILLWFLMNFSWLIDALYNVFIIPDLSLESLTCIVPLIGILLILCQYPDKDEADEALIDRKLLLTGLSQTQTGNITERNIDLLLKPLCSKVEVDGKENSLCGLVRFVILPSEQFSDSKFDVAFIDQVDSKDLKDKMIEYNALSDFVPKRQSMESWLSAYCRYKYEKEISFHIEEPVDYNLFDKVFKTFETCLDKYEERQGEAILYVSSGTSILSGALSMLAVPGKRIILYCSQGGKTVEMALKVFTPSVKSNSLFRWFSILQEDDKPSSIIQK